MYCDSWYVFFGVNNSVKERKLKSYPFGQSQAIVLALPTNRVHHRNWGKFIPRWLGCANWWRPEIKPMEPKVSWGSLLWLLLVHWFMYYLVWSHQILTMCQIHQVIFLFCARNCWSWDVDFLRIPKSCRQPFTSKTSETLWSKRDKYWL